MKLRYLHLLLLFLLSFIQLNCKKEPLFDYRKKYLGNFKFISNKKIYVAPAGIQKETLTSEGRIERAARKNYILIYFIKGKFVEVKMDKAGTFTSQSSSTHGLDGSFSSKNNIAFSLWEGGHGGFVSYDVTGEK